MSDSVNKTGLRAESHTRTLLLAGFLVCSILLAVFLIFPGAFQFMDNKTSDAVMAFSKSRPASGAVVIIDIDEKSLSRFGQWPWPRGILAELLRRIQEGGASGVGLNLLLSEPDRTSPPHPPGAPGAINDHDRLLADTLRGGPFVLGYEFLFEDAARTLQSCDLHPPDVIRIERPAAQEPDAGLFRASGSVCNLEPFTRAVSRSGFLNAAPDRDGILRRAPMMINFKDHLYPSLALATLMRARNETGLHLRRTVSGHTSLLLGQTAIPLDRAGNLLVHFKDDMKVVPRVSAADVLEGSAPENGFREKLVVVGFSAAGWNRIYQTPAGPLHAHADFHASILENILTGDLIDRSAGTRILEFLIGLILTLLLALAIDRMEIYLSTVVGCAGVAAVWIAAKTVFESTGHLYSPLLPTVFILVNLPALNVLKARKKQSLSGKQAADTLVLLKSSQNSLNSIIQTVPDIIFRVDSEGKITFISPAISKYTCPAGESLLGTPIFSLVAPADMNKARYHLNEKRTGQRATHGLEIRLLLARRPGENHDNVGYFSVSAEGIYSGAVPSSHDFIGTQGILRDITEKKTLEGRLERAQKMEAVGNLASGIAHDLNNILSGLVSYPELLLLDLPENSPLRQKVLAIQQSGERAAAMVQDLLTLARRGVTVSKVIQLNDIVRSYLSSPEHQNLLSMHPRVWVKPELSADLMCIKGSPVHLSKAVMNLVSNAMEAMPAGGHIYLSTFNRYADTPLKGYEEIPGGEYVCLSVRDEGIGISPEDLKRIFEPFYTRKAMKRSGTGLGMTVIWATVKDLNGHFDISSSEGTGTRIDLYLPATREGKEASNERTVLEDYIGTERILIVDDASEQREIAGQILGRLGYQVSSVSSGESAVEFIRAHEVDLLVLDMIMPDGIDGLETFRRIHEIRPAVRAIIASGYSESDRVRQLQTLGAGPYIQKPYTMEKIGLAVRKELDRKP